MSAVGVSRYRRACRVVLASACCFAMVWTLSGRADSKTAAADVERGAPQGVVPSKLQLLDTLVHRSPAVGRIERSGDEEALNLLEKARQALQEVRAKLDQGEDPATLEPLLDEGLRAAGDASRRVVDAEGRKRREQRRYEELRRRVVSFREALAQIAASKSSDAPELGAARDYDAALMAASRDADEGRYREANRQLQELADTLETALVQARDRETVVYELKFDSPEEEYAYEQERNRSHVMLLDLLRESRPATGQRMDFFDRLVAENEALKREAEALAARGEIEAAIKKLEEGTAGLVKALRVGGLAL